MAPWSIQEVCASNTAGKITWQDVLHVAFQYNCFVLFKHFNFILLHHTSKINSESRYISKSIIKLTICFHLILFIKMYNSWVLFKCFFFQPHIFLSIGKQIYADPWTPFSTRMKIWTLPTTNLNILDRWNCCHKSDLHDICMYFYNIKKIQNIWYRLRI